MPTAARDEAKVTAQVIAGWRDGGSVRLAKPALPRLGRRRLYGHAAVHATARTAIAAGSAGSPAAGSQRLPPATISPTPTSTAAVVAPPASPPRHPVDNKLHG